MGTANRNRRRQHRIVPQKKNGCPTADKAIVSLAYDDNLESQLKNAVPQLNEHGMRGTFYLNDVVGNLDAWKQVREVGHELGSHTKLHPCMAKFDWVKEGNASEDYSLERMAKELDEQIALLKTLGERKPFSFAYPCGTTWIGKEQTRYMPFVEERFVAARGVGGDIITPMGSPMNVPAYFLEGPLEAYAVIVESSYFPFVVKESVWPDSRARPPQASTWFHILCKFSFCAGK